MPEILFTGRMYTLIMSPARSVSLCCCSTNRGKIFNAIWIWHSASSKPNSVYRFSWRVLIIWASGKHCEQGARHYLSSPICPLASASGFSPLDELLLERPFISRLAHSPPRRYGFIAPRCRRAHSIQRDFRIRLRRSPCQRVAQKSRGGRQHPVCSLLPVKRKRDLVQRFTGFLPI